MSYDSNADSGDDLFDDNHAPQDTVATLPLPKHNGHITQPTQPLTYPPNNPVFNRSSSPSVQVSASSPAARRTPSSATPRPSPHPSSALNGGKIPMAMAPPGTQYRAPGGLPPSQFTQTQTQRLDDSDEDAIGDSDGPDHSADIRPSAFIRGSGGSNGGPARVQESPFKAYASQFTMQTPQKRSADDMASAYASAQRKPKVPRQTGPARAQPPSAPGDEVETLNDIPDYSLAQKVGDMRTVFPMYSVKACYLALNARRGHYEDALEYLTNNREHTQAEKQNADSIDLTSEEDEEPLPAVKPSTAKRDVGKSASITQKWSSTQTTKQQPTISARSIQDKYGSAPQKTQSSPQAQEAFRKPGRVLGRKKPVELNWSSPVTSPAKPPANVVNRQQRRAVIEEDDEDEEEEARSDESDNDSGVEVQDQGPLDTKLLDLINTCSTADLQDLATSTTPDVIEKVLAQRPFSNLDKIREVSVDVTQTTKNGKTRTSRRKIGDKLVDTCLDMMGGYQAVDELVQECEKRGKAMAKDMKQWGLNAFGASTTPGELDMTDLESAHDSGIGTPSSTPSHDGENGKRKLLKQPKTLSPDLTMMDHQIAGLNWLALLYTHELSGILADDMGLGKTLQIIAYLTHLNEAQISEGPHLIIVPGSTIENWLREFKNFSPSLRVEPYYGGINERPRRQVEIKDALSSIHVVVTTYDMAVKPDDLKFLRKEVKPVVCVWDEAHELKNSQSKKYKALVRIPAQQRLMLTGTPVQNNLAEMASLLAFLMPSVFAEREEDLQVIFKNKAKLDTAAGAGKGTDNKKSALLSADRIARARSMITPFILRRKKHQVLKSLPKKTSTVEYCKLKGDQAALYTELEDKYRRYLEAKRRNKDAKPDFVDDGAVGADALKKPPRRTKTAAELESGKDDAITSILTSLRKAAIHPLLFRRHYTDALLHKITQAFVSARENKNKDYNAQFVFEDFQVMCDFEIHRWCTSPEQPQTVRKYALKNKPWRDGSAKVLKLVELLQEHAKGGHRTLIFSQFTSVMDILESSLSEVDIAYFRLDGQTKMEQRQDMIDAFHAAPNAVPDADGKVPEGACSVFMLSTGAGGQGINLACADRVVIFDSGFNPHQDLQAENRAHRVGQTRDVVVTKLVSAGTIEEQILKVGLVKVKLDEEVAGGGEAAAASGTATPNGEMRNERQGKGMVESLLAEKLEGAKEAGANGVKKEEGEEDVKRENEEETKNEDKDLAKAFAEGLKSAGVNVKK